MKKFITEGNIERFTFKLMGNDLIYFKNELFMGLIELKESIGLTL